MKKALPGIAAVLMSCLSVAAFGSYADDRAEIENLSARYLVAMDAGDTETYISCFTEDGVLDWVRGVEHGREAIRKAISGFGSARAAVPDGATSRPRTRHVVLNHVINVKGDTASTLAYWVAFTNNTPQKDVQVMYFGHYEDELVKQNGRWLFKKRKVYNESLQNRALFYPALGEKDPRAK
jgi:uncharacterized protein (TIGR02246 family)